MPKIQPKKEYTKVINFYELPEIKKNMTTVSNPGFHLTEIKLPCRMVVVALSGGGKTNFVMNFIIFFYKTKMSNLEEFLAEASSK